MQASEIITVYIGNLRIDEPIVTLTDLLVSAVCFYAARKLLSMKNLSRARKALSWYFILMGIATIFGGILGHAFFYALSPLWKLPGWLTSMMSVMFIERAAINHAGTNMTKTQLTGLRGINILEFLVFVALTLTTLNFFYVEFHSAYGLLVVVLGFELYMFFKYKNKASAEFLLGLAFVALAGIVFMNKVSIHEWFNHLALSHTLMAMAAWFFYRGGRIME